MKHGRLPGARRRVRGQSMTETNILVAVVGIGLAVISWKLPQAIQKRHQQNVRVVASPL